MLFNFIFVYLLVFVEGEVCNFVDGVWCDLIKVDFIFG